jgi:hypothetical protein
VKSGIQPYHREEFEYKYALRTRPSPPPPNPPPPAPPLPPWPPPAFKQVAPLNDSVGGVPIWVFIVVAATVLFGCFLGAIMYYRRVRKGRKARGESDPDFVDDLRSPDPNRRRWGRNKQGSGSGPGGGLEENFAGVNPTMRSDAAMAAAAGGGGGGGDVFARPDLAKPGVLSRKDDGGAGGVFARPDLARAGVVDGDDNTGAARAADVGSYGAEEGSYGDEGGGEGPMLRWDPATQSWTRDAQQQQRGGAGGSGAGATAAPGSIASPVKPKSVSFGRPPSMKLKAGAAETAEPWAGASGTGSGSAPPPPPPGGPLPPQIKDGEFVRRSVPMNPAVVDAMSRREVIRALETRGVDHEDLLDDDAEDDELRRRLKLHACASRDQMEAAEAAATEVTRREYEKTLETPAGEWF